MPAVDASDFLNPVLVKELRQGLKSRAFNFSFMLMQGLMVIGIAIQVLAREAGGGSGVEASTVVFWLFAAAPLLVMLPAQAINAIYGEHRQQTLPLVLLTRLTPWRMATGKWLSLMAQAMLIACAVLPYLVLRYFLGGVNVALDLLIFTILLGACAVLCAGGLLLSTIKHPWKAFWIGFAVLFVFSPMGIVIAIPFALLVYGMSGRPGLIPLQLLLAAGALLHWTAGRFANYHVHERVAPRIYSFVLLFLVIGCVQAATKFAPVLLALPILLPPLLFNLVEAARLARPAAPERRRVATVLAAAIGLLALLLLSQDLPAPGRLHVLATLAVAFGVPAGAVWLLRRWLTPFVPMLFLVELMLLLVGGALIATWTHELKTIPVVLQVLPCASFLIAVFGKGDASFTAINAALAATALLALARVAWRADDRPAPSGGRRDRPEGPGVESPGQRPGETPATNRASPERAAVAGDGPR